MGGGVGRQTKTLEELLAVRRVRRIFLLQKIHSSNIYRFLVCEGAHEYYYCRSIPMFSRFFSTGYTVRSAFSSLDFDLRVFVDERYRGPPYTTLQKKSIDSLTLAESLVHFDNNVIIFFSHISQSLEDHIETLGLSNNLVVRVF